ncbi:MAG: endolytic transglycosylase MltG [Ruminococcaceae bacterium]|nr:endolytic transglycosylase MltG [Oscillospiraceae bacterium]
MSDKRINGGDAYDELLSSFYSSKNDNEIKDEVKNRGEVYFSSNTGHKKTAQPQRRQQTQRPVREAASNSPKKAVPQKRRMKKKNNNMQNSILAVIVVVVVFISAFLIRIPLMGCINDILAIDVSDTDFRVVLDKDMDAFEVIDELAEKKLINNPMFCKLFAKIMSLDTKTDREGNKKTIVFPAGTYFLNSSMGVEGMLNEIRTNGMESNTVKVTFPEGFNIEQIFEKLDESGVCSAQSLHKVMDSDEFFSKFTFLSSVTEKSLRYRVLEGYLYPDTYEFYIGEAPTSVIERFLNNFEAKWSDAYSTKATELGYTVDEILTVASILEKEAFDAEQMPIIASVIYNRLESSSFPFINCDSTAQYIDNFKESLEASGQYVDLMKVYDTYQKTGLPIGPICCPGADAIHAALHPESTDYYYFCHDKEGKIYLASTDAEHQNNLQYLE